MIFVTGDHAWLKSSDSVPLLIKITPVSALLLAVKVRVPLPPLANPQKPEAPFTLPLLSVALIVAELPTSLKVGVKDPVPVKAVLVGKVRMCVASLGVPLVALIVQLAGVVVSVSPKLITLIAWAASSVIVLLAVMFKVLRFAASAVVVPPAGRFGVQLVAVDQLPEAFPAVSAFQA